MSSGQEWLVEQLSTQTCTLPTAHCLLRIARSVFALVSCGLATVKENFRGTVSTAGRVTASGFRVLDGPRRKNLPHPTRAGVVSTCSQSL